MKLFFRVLLIGLIYAHASAEPSSITAPAQGAKILLTPSDATQLLPGCQLIKSQPDPSDPSPPAYNYRCNSNLTFSPPKEVSQCAISSTDPKAMDCLYQTNDAGPSVKLRINCYEFAAWAKDKNKWICNVTAPAIPGCSFSKNNTLTGFFEYNCSVNNAITGTSAKGKCQSGSLDLDNKSYYCLGAEASSDIRVMLKCPGTWSPNPQNQGGFICTAGTKNKTPGM